MSTTTNTQVITENIYTQGAHLCANDVYTEKNPTDNYRNCDCIFVDHNKKTFWFTTKAHVQHTQQLTH